MLCVLPVQLFATYFIKEFNIKNVLKAKKNIKGWRNFRGMFERDENSAAYDVG
jgi:hypothetical protein